MDVVLDGFSDLELIGRGGFSRVYRARQDDFDREVAIKVLDIGLDERQRLAFQRECRAMGVVSQHPNIVTVLSAAFTAEGRPAIVMELYGGGTYADRVQRDGPLAGTEVLELGIRVSGALQTAHDRGLLHRDVKPQNLFVSDYGEPALGDFGISSFEGEESDGGGLTVHYAAPEVIEHQHASPASDVYSLAATLYTIAAGRRPFALPGQKQRVADVALRILREPPPRIGGSCPPQLERAILQGMAKRPEDRPASAASFGRLLQAAQEGIGTSRTELAVAQSPSAAAETELTLPSPPSGPTTANEEETATVLRPRPQPSVSVEPEAEQAPRRRRVVSMVSGALAVLALAIVAAVAATWLGREDDAGLEASVPEADAAEDDFFVQVRPPGDISVARADEETAIVRWDTRDNERYQVERVDDGHSEVTETDIDGVQLAISPTERPCVVVRTVAANGRMSPDSPVVCLRDG